MCITDYVLVPRNSIYSERERKVGVSWVVCVCLSAACFASFFSVWRGGGCNPELQTCSCEVKPAKPHRIIHKTKCRNAKPLSHS